MASHPATPPFRPSAVRPRRSWSATIREPTTLLGLALLFECALVLAVLRGSSAGPAAAVLLALVAFAAVRLTVVGLPPRAQPVAFAGLAVILTPALAHIIVTGGRELAIVFGLAGLVLALIVLTPRPAAVFAGWLVLAPLLQLSAREDPRGYWLNSVLYLAPPLVFALWTLTPSRARRARPAPRLIDTLPIAYLLLASVSLSFSSWARRIGYHTAVDQLYQNIGIGVSCYYFCAFGTGGRGLANRFAGALLASGCVLSLLTYVEKTTGWTLWNGGSSEEGRAAASLSSPGVLGAYLGAAIAVATAALLWRGPRSLRRLSIATLILAVPALGFTLTRGPILATLIVVGSMIAFRRSGFRFAAAGIAILIAVGVVNYWGTISSSTLYRDRLADTKNIQGRLLIDRWSVKLFESRPVLGYGYGSFDAIKNAAQLSPGKLPLAAGKEYTSHNTFLTILVEMGGVGLGLLVLPWLKVSFDALQAVARRRTDVAWLLIGCVGIVGTYAFTALTTDMRFFSIVPVLPWVALGLIRARLGAVKA